ncbi:MAG: hypothetical protein GY856_54605 [bacterium]|nr:hypothetical protein [bacterium]
MNSVFTEYVRSLELAPPDSESFAELWEALRAVLAGEMKKRGIRSSPPSCRGGHGRPTRREAEGPGREEERGRAEPGPDRPAPRLQPDDALEELTAECYAFIFVRRLRGLRAQLKVRSDIDDLIYLNARHFLHDSERRLAAGTGAVDPSGLVRRCQAVDSGRVSTMRRRHSSRGSGEGGASR